MSAFISFENVKKTYHMGEIDIHALDDVSFEIEQGEFVIIAGEADYYPLSTAWMVSSIFGKFFKLNVELYANTDDADADLNDFLSQLIKYSR